MFRELYKEANDCVRGDRGILDKAFLQAAQPEKKKNPVYKYSFIGTAVAAVMVVGAVFANPTVFTNRSETIGLPDVTPTESVVATEAYMAAAENDEVTPVNSTFTADEVPAVDFKTKVKVAGTQETKADATVDTDSNDGGNGQYDAIVMSLEGEDDAFVESATEEQVMFKIVRPERNDAATEEASEQETAEIEAFSYMYDLSCGYDMMTEGFVNTDVCPVTNREEAIKRAMNECTVDYKNIYVEYDMVEGVWKITFSCDDEVASEQIVYMNTDGITLGIVYLA